MEKIMRKKAITYSLLMSVSISLFLSLFGLGISGHFTIPGWIVSFVLSTIISIIIGFIVPMKKITMALENKLPSKPAVFFVSALISDVIYTPIISASMVALAARNAPVPFGILYLRSVIPCFIVCYFVILIFQFAYRKILMPPMPPKQADTE